jgi:hypothetical protein
MKIKRSGFVLIVRATLLAVTGIFLLMAGFFPLTTLEAAPTQDSSYLQIVGFSAQARYNVGLAFSLKARTTRGQINQIELRAVYGKNPAEQKVDSVVFSPGSTIEAKAEVVADDVPLAAGMPITYYWVIANSYGDLARTEARTLTYEDTRFSWRQRSGAQITVRWYSGDEDYGNLLYSLAADSLATYKRRFSISPTEHIYVSIYASSRDYFSAAPSDVPNWSGGYTLPYRNEILAIAPQHRLATTLAGEGIPHEVSHAALYQHLGHKYAPSWLDEGLAVYNQNVVAPEYDEMAQAAARQNQLMPLASLNKGFPSDRDAALLAYAEGRSMVTFLINNYGDAVFSNLLDQLRYGNVDQAMQKVFGVSLADMEEQWHNSLTGKKSTLPTALLKGPVSSTPPVSNSRPTSREVSDPTLLNLGIIGLLLSALLLVVALVLYILRKRKKAVEPEPALPGIPGTLPPVPVNNFNPYQAGAPLPGGIAMPIPPIPPVTMPQVAPAPNLAQPAPAPFSTEVDPFDIIAATFGNRAAPSSPASYSPPPSAPSYYPGTPGTPDNDPYGLGHGGKSSG